MAWPGATASHCHRPNSEFNPRLFKSTFFYSIILNASLSHKTRIPRPFWPFFRRISFLTQPSTPILGIGVTPNGSVQIFPAHLPPNVVCEHSDPVHAAVADLPSGASVLVMSFSHAEDLDVVAACLKRQRLHGDLKFVGLIGSKTKQSPITRQISCGNSHLILLPNILSFTSISLVEWIAGQGLSNGLAC